MRDWCSVCQAMRFRSECNHPPAPVAPAGAIPAAGPDCLATLPRVSDRKCRHGYSWQCPTAVVASKAPGAPAKGIRC